MNTLTRNEYKHILRIVTNPHFRRSQNLVFIEGDSVAKELYLQDKSNIQAILVTEKTKNQYKGQNVFLINDDTVNRLTTRINGFDTAVLYSTKHINEGTPEKVVGFNIGLVNIQDPGNLGTIFRTARAFNVENIFLFDNCVDPLNQKVIDTSLGAVLTQPYCKAIDLRNIKQKYKNLNIIATTVKNAEDYKNTKSEKPILVLFGNEGKGLPNEYVDLANTKIHIPINNIDSLNVSVSVGIICSHYQH